jgi:hypothetical protein
MQNNAWVELLRQVPPKLHQNLLVMTAVGNEIAVQDIVRLEPEYLVIRGRLAGTSDLGRAFFIPFDRIIYIGFQKPVLPTELYGMYGAAPPEPRVESQPAAATAPTDAEQSDAPPAGGAGAAVHATPPQGINRTELLQRIKSRAQQAGVQGFPVP